MRAVDQWQLIEGNLPDDWEELTLSFVSEEISDLGSAAAALAPLGPGRLGNELRVHVRRSGGGGGPQLLRNLLRRLDRKRVWGTLTLVDARTPQTGTSPAPRAGAAAKRPLAEAWDAAVASLPPDWSDLLCELELDSSDYIPRAALLGAPLNPARNPEALALRFRAAGTKGYGAPSGLVRRCLERMDADGVTGTLTVLNALSETDNVGTQGPVWRIAGRSV
jgi:hypothetical protein